VRDGLFVFPPSPTATPPRGGENQGVIEIQLIVGFFSPIRGDAAKQQRGL